MHKSPAAKLNRFHVVNGTRSSNSSNRISSSKFKRTRHDRSISSNIANRYYSTLISNRSCPDNVVTGGTPSSRSVKFGPDIFLPEEHSLSPVKKTIYPKSDKNTVSFDKKRYSQGQTNWPRKVTKDTVEEFNVSSQSISALRTTSIHCQIPTPDVRTVMDTGDIPTWIPTTSNIDDNVDTLRDRSQEVSDVLTRPNGSLVNNFTETGSQNLSTSSSPQRNNPIENASLVRSSEMFDVTSSNLAHDMMEIDDFPMHGENRVLTTHENNDSHLSRSRQINHITGSAPSTLSILTGINSIIEVLPGIYCSSYPELDKLLKECRRLMLDMSFLNRSSMALNQYGSYRTNSHQTRAAATSTESNNLDTMSVVDSSIPQPCYSQASKKRPIVHTILREQNGHVVKKLVDCAICLEENVGNVLLVPCLHYNLCFNCYKKLRNWSCPLCRSPITSITVYV